ncbi:MAG: MNIO family bufferin maturase [Beijerinckiaceae bacterium]
MTMHTHPAMPVRPVSCAGLPARAGIGFKPEHFEGLLARPAGISFLEVHAENYMGDGGPPHAMLAALRALYPLSLHGVGLSIGGEAPLDQAHLNRLAALIARYEPDSFSEHLAWSSHDEFYFNDLLPVAYDTATLQRVVRHIDEIQTRLKRRMLLENPSTYVAFEASTWDEIDFIAEVARRSGCGLLLDVNNVQVTCTNHGRDPMAYLDAFPVNAVGEIHLAGYAEDQDSLGHRLLIDAHGTPVAPDVWPLYDHALRRTGPVATLIEWDNDVPALEILGQEAVRADSALLGEQARRNWILK